MIKDYSSYSKTKYKSFKCEIINLVTAVHRTSRLSKKKHYTVNVTTKRCVHHFTFKHT